MNIGRRTTALLLLLLVAGSCMPRPSYQRVGARVVDGQAEILVGLCDGEALDWLQVRGPADTDGGEEEEFVAWWEIQRIDAAQPGSLDGKREQIITVGEVPEGFTETLALRGPVPEPPQRLFGWLRMQTGTRASVQFHEQAYEGDGRWWVLEGGGLLTTDELLAERTRVCPEAAGQ